MRVIQGLLAAAIIIAGVKKLAGDIQQVQMFTEVFGYSIEFIYFVGICEILVGIGLLIGLWNPPIALLASGGILSIMAGAVFTHLYAGQEIGTAMPSAILFVLGMVIFIDKGKNIKRKKVLERITKLH